MPSTGQNARFVPVCKLLQYDRVAALATDRIADDEDIREKEAFSACHDPVLR